MLKFLCEHVLWILVLVVLVRNREPYYVEKYLLWLFILNSGFMVAKFYVGFISARNRRADVTKGHLYAWMFFQSAVNVNFYVMSYTSFGGENEVQEWFWLVDGNSGGLAAYVGVFLGIY